MRFAVSNGGMVAKRERRFMEQLLEKLSGYGSANTVRVEFPILRFWKRWCLIHDPPGSVIQPYEIFANETYGEAVNRAINSYGSFLLLEHDIALEPPSLDEIVELVRESQGEVPVVADYTIWHLGHTPHRRFDDKGNLLFVERGLSDWRADAVGFGCIYLPSGLWKKVWGIFEERKIHYGYTTDYPSLDIEFSIVMRGLGVRALRVPTQVGHLHWGY